MEKLFNDTMNNDNTMNILATVIGGGKITEKSYDTAKTLCTYFREPSSEYKVNLRRLASSNQQELKKLKGIGTRQANLISAIIQLSRQINNYTDSNISINCPEDAYALLNDMRYLRHEEFRVILLDTKNNVINVKLISKGILDMSIIHPREIFKVAVDYLASSIILVHNHPSGNPSASSYDIEISKNIVAAGKIMNIDIVDHIILGSNSFISLKEKRLM